MANEKELQGRLVHKNDTEANWVKATNFTPKQGELIIYNPDATHSYSRFKIGDGTTKVNTLPFIANIQNLVDGNGTGSIRGIGAKSDYTMGKYAFAEGYSTIASGYQSHAEGGVTTASNDNSHAEGYETTASGYCSHAEGSYTTASGDSSHAEGYEATASGLNSHAEGYVATASGDYSHAEGYYTTASSDSSHAEGNYTIASSRNQHVQGKYNIEDTTGTYAHIVGNGTSTSARSNAHTLDWDGNAWFAGNITLGTAKSQVATISDIQAYIDEAILGGSW